MRTVTIAFVVSTACFGCDELLAEPQTPTGHVAGTDSDPRALTAWDEVLAGYGDWSDDDVLGTVWTPADPTFVPYATHGRFVNMDGSVVWLSELPWGAATLHHGRWVSSNGRWHWVPGLVRSNAWVRWSHAGPTTSWSPAPPNYAWHNGIAVRINPPQEPTVATIDDDGLTDATTHAEDTEFTRSWLGQ